MSHNVPSRIRLTNTGQSWQQAFELLEFRGGRWVRTLALPLAQRLPETLSSPLRGPVSGFVQTEKSPFDHDYETLPVTEMSAEPVKEWVEPLGIGDDFPAEPPKPSRTWSAMLVSALIAGSVWFFMRMPEPVYQGKHLNGWLAESDGPSSVLSQPSLVAVRHMGTNAFPFLAKMLTERDSSLKRFLFSLDSSLVVDTAESSHRRAMAAFRSLGPDARAAIPLLANSLKNKYATTNSAFALTLIGPEALALLVSGFRDLDNKSRLELVDAIGSNFFNYPDNIPFLIKCLDDGDARVRAEAAVFLGEGRGVGAFSKDSAQVVQALVKALGDKDARVRAQAALSLRYHGIAAKAQIPAPVVSLLDADNTSRT